MTEDLRRLAAKVPIWRERIQLQLRWQWVAIGTIGALVVAEIVRRFFGE